MQRCGPAWVPSGGRAGVLGEGWSGREALLPPCAQGRHAYVLTSADFSAWHLSLCPCTVGSLQPSRTAEFLADPGQGGRRAAAGPEAALRGLPAQAGGGPQRGVETRLSAASLPLGPRGAGPADVPAAGVSLVGGRSSCPAMLGSPPALMPRSSSLHRARSVRTFGLLCPDSAACSRRRWGRPRASCESGLLGASGRLGSRTLGFVCFLTLLLCSSKLCDDEVKRKDVQMILFFF